MGFRLFLMRFEGIIVNSEIDIDKNFSGGGKIILVKGLFMATNK